MYLFGPDAQFIPHSSVSKDACGCTQPLRLRKKKHIFTCRAINSPRRGGHEHSKVKRPRNDSAKLLSQHNGRIAGKSGRSIDAREAAIRQLFLMEMTGATVKSAASSAQAGGNGRQTAVTRYVNNVTRHRRRLDWVLQHLCHRQLAKMDPLLRQLLRLGLFELVMENSVPAYVVSNYVNLSRSLVGKSVSSLVNAVLRNAQRALDQGDGLLPPMPSPADPLPVKSEAYGVAYSHPTWMVERWLRRFGEQDTLALLEANNRTPQHSLRVSSLNGHTAGGLMAALSQRESVAVSRSVLLPDEFLCVHSGLHLVLRDFVANGSCMVQDEAAGLVVALLDPQPGETVLDACAAPGGKTLFAAARMNNQGSLVALDLEANKLHKLIHAADLCGVGSLLSVCAGSIQALAAGKQITVLRSGRAVTDALDGTAPGNVATPLLGQSQLGMSAVRPSSSVAPLEHNSLAERRSQLEASSSWQSREQEVPGVGNGNVFTGWEADEDFLAGMDDFYGSSVGSSGVEERKLDAATRMSEPQSTAGSGPSHTKQASDPISRAEKGEQNSGGDGGSVAGSLVGSSRTDSQAAGIMRRSVDDAAVAMAVAVAVAPERWRPPEFDRVLLDAPCSGHGVLAKRADLRWRWSPRELSQRAELQAEMLRTAAKLVKPGGLLAYSTCSIEPEENEQQVHAFVQAHTEFAIEPAPEGLLPKTSVTPEGFLSMMPHRHGTDGAFAARLRKRS